MEKKCSTEVFIPPTFRSKHAESLIVLSLYQLHSPFLTVLQNWVKMIADSVETMAFQLYNPAQTKTHTEDGYITQAVKVWTRRCKVSSNFAKDMIDVFMGYIIFQAHTHTPKPLGNTDPKRKTQANKSSSSKTSVDQTTTTPAAQLMGFQGRHNFQPLTLWYTES
ncbi:hypothetical protein H4Q26_005425 [Puccinia striiformis f. sp. tritici PST-130]|nr:hypothetical protein H4Q26_005425 [Puccinia striiformis f. sp. tritici PST-130]